MLKFLKKKKPGGKNGARPFTSLNITSALESDDIQFIRYYLAQKEEALPWPDALGNTLIHTAAEWNATEICKYLIEIWPNEIDLSLKNNAGKTPLFYAQKNGNIVLCALFKEDTPSYDESDDIPEEEGYMDCSLSLTPEYRIQRKKLKTLDNALETDDLDFVKIHINTNDPEKQLINIPDAYGNTLLHRAASWGAYNVCHYLITAYNADPSIKNSAHQTPGLLAKKHKDNNLNELLSLQQKELTYEGKLYKPSP